jgi:hypothetical protein
MSKIFLALCFLFFSVLSFSQVTDYNLSLDVNFPQWLKDGDVRTEQTSGITFIKSERGLDYFLLADDIGVIHLLIIKDEKILSIDQIEFINETQNFFPSFPKMDFEEISYDRTTGEVYLSVEGNGEHFNDYVGIFKLIFKNRDILTKKVISIIRVNYRPENLFFKYTNWNIAYEGFTFDNNFYYLGLEGFQNDNLFADSTLIFIGNKNDMQIIKSISTKQLGIHTICGLFSDKNYSLWGVDRNNRKIFHIIFTENFEIKSFSLYESSTQIPGYKNLNFLPSFESITMDDKNNLYIVDDPWKQVFVPDSITFDKLDIETKSNFKSYIPTIYKYKLTPKGDN